MEVISKMDDEEALALLYDWTIWARDNQLSPKGDWFVWLILSGRGFGKTRTGAEWVLRKARLGKYGRIALVGETAADARDVIIEGESGILECAPPWFKPKYTPSRRRVEFPNGVIAFTYSGDDPEQLRGPQHDIAWVDELAKFKHPQEAWENLEFGLRLGPKPQIVATTTPKPIPIIKDLVQDDKTVITKGSTYENIQNLPQHYIDRIVKRYENTRLGRQELYAEILDNNPDALWNRSLIEQQRTFKMPQLVKAGVAIDPAGTSKDSSSETGIVAGGVDENGYVYITNDSTIKARPNKWASQAISVYNQLEANAIIGEVNNGGEMVEEVVKNIDSTVNFKSVRASKGKYARAEPVSSLYEQGIVFHVGQFAELEDQMCEWIPGEGESPDRLDALVWLVTWLKLQKKEPAKIRAKSVRSV